MMRRRGTGCIRLMWCCAIMNVDEERSNEDDQCIGSTIRPLGISTKIVARRVRLRCPRTRTDRIEQHGRIFH
eukprot:IDg3537t1